MTARLPFRLRRRHRPFGRLLRPCLGGCMPYLERGSNFGGTRAHLVVTGDPPALPSGKCPRSCSRNHAGNPSMPSTLEVWRPEGCQRFSLEGEPFTIGSAASSDVMLASDDTVSRLHAILEQVGDSWCLRDLASATAPPSTGSASSPSGRSTTATRSG